MTMEKKSTEKIQRMIKIINRLKKENEELKRELNEKNIMLERIT